MLENVNIAPGQWARIAELSDDQVLAHARIQVMRLRSVHAILNTPQIGPVASVMYDVKVVDPQKVGELLREGIRALYPLLAEMFLRNISGGSVRNDLCVLLGREGQMTFPDPLCVVGLSLGNGEYADGGSDFLVDDMQR